MHIHAHTYACYLIKPNGLLMSRDFTMWSTWIVPKRWFVHNWHTWFLGNSSVATCLRSPGCYIRHVIFCCQMMRFIFGGFIARLFIRIGGHPGAGLIVPWSFLVPDCLVGHCLVSVYSHGHLLSVGWRVLGEVDWLEGWAPKCWDTYPSHSDVFGGGCSPATHGNSGLCARFYNCCFWVCLPRLWPNSEASWLDRGPPDGGFYVPAYGSIFLQWISCVRDARAVMHAWIAN